MDAPILVFRLVLNDTLTVVFPLKKMSYTRINIFLGNGVFVKEWRGLCREASHGLRTISSAKIKIKTFFDKIKFFSVFF